MVESSKNSLSFKASGEGCITSESLSVRAVKVFKRKLIFEKPFEGTGVTVPSIILLNFSQDETGILISHSLAPSSILQPFEVKVIVAAGPSLTSKQSETGFLIEAIISFDFGSSSQRFSRVPSTAYILRYASVLWSVIATPPLYIEIKIYQLNNIKNRL